VRSRVRLRCVVGRYDWFKRRGPRECLPAVKTTEGDRVDTAARLLRSARSAMGAPIGCRRHFRTCVDRRLLPGSPWSGKHEKSSGSTRYFISRRMRRTRIRAQTATLLPPLGAHTHLAYQLTTTPRRQRPRRIRRSPDRRGCLSGDAAARSPWDTQPRSRARDRSPHRTEHLAQLRCIRLRG
jgi:hypothetical protein